MPQASFDEHALIERSDDSLWLLAWTSRGMYESESTDGGKTWVPPRDAGLSGARSKFYIRRLGSGRLSVHYVVSGQLITTTKDGIGMCIIKHDPNGEDYVNGGYDTKAAHTNALRKDATKFGVSLNIPDTQSVQNCRC